jgi:hypothetical protein
MPDLALVFRDAVLGFLLSLGGFDYVPNTDAGASKQRLSAPAQRPVFMVALGDGPELRLLSSDAGQEPRGSARPAANTIKAVFTLRH